MVRVLPGDHNPIQNITRVLSDADLPGRESGRKAGELRFGRGLPPDF
ncbi:hypothetical protein [uncultured Methanospirillum sp.]|nr:hypothetical protein [uncultured Methanospirillum sp.]